MGECRPFEARDCDLLNDEVLYHKPGDSGPKCVDRYVICPSGELMDVTLDVPACRAEAVEDCGAHEVWYTAESWCSGPELLDYCD